MLCTALVLAAGGYAIQSGVNPSVVNEAISGNVRILQEYADALNKTIQEINATLQTELDASYYALQKPYDYIIANASTANATLGTYYYTMQNGTTGALDYYSTNQTLVEQYALGNLTKGGAVFIKNLQHNSSLTISASIQIFESYQGNFQTYEPFNVSVAVSIGNVLFLNSTGYFKANATSSATMPGILLVAQAASASQYALCLREGLLTVTSWSWTVGQPIYVGNSTVLTQSYPSASGNIVEIVGYAVTATSIYFEPNLAMVTIT
jgi:hypothetical protein